jgi:hypothetical protein
MGLVEMIIAQRLLSVSRQKGDLIRFARGILNPDIISAAVVEHTNALSSRQSKSKKDPTSRSNA